METKGLPLDFLLSNLDREHYVVDWQEFIRTAQQHNWKLRGTLIKVENVLIDVYGRKDSEEIIRMLKYYVTILEEKLEN